MSGSEDQSGSAPGETSARRVPWIALAVVALVIVVGTVATLLWLTSQITLVP